MTDTSTERSTRDFIEQAERYGAHNYHPLPVVLSRGEGALVWDVEGKRYYDFLSAYSAVNQGHCHPRIVAALQEQAGRLALTSRAFHNDRMGDMLQRIAELTGLPRVLPMNTGAEGVETAIKAMRRWGYEKKGVPQDRAEILVAKGNFHGRTTTIVGFSDDPTSWGNYGPFAPGFTQLPFGDAAAFEQAIGPNTVGILVEPIQGEAGVLIPPDDFLPRLREACTANQVALCLDEIQTGLGRTGRMFAFEHFDDRARPDLTILGKALSGGLYPVSCVAGSDEVMGVFTPGTHGSTYGGNPLGAATCLAALDVLEQEQLPERAADLGSHAHARLEKELTTQNLEEVRARGLMLAIEYTHENAKAAAKELLQEGVLAKDTHGSTLRFAPALVITREQLDEALDIIVRVCNRY